MAVEKGEVGSREGEGLILPARSVVFLNEWSKEVVWKWGERVNEREGERGREIERGGERVG